LAPSYRQFGSDRLVGGPFSSQHHYTGAGSAWRWDTGNVE
jgi:hypothetical protein